MFQWDNDPKHASKVLKEWIQQTRIHILEWTPQSPDLNSIQKVWTLLKTQLQNNLTPTVLSRWLVKNSVARWWISNAPEWGQNGLWMFNTVHCCTYWHNWTGDIFRKATADSLQYQGCIANYMSELLNDWNSTAMMIVKGECKLSNTTLTTVGPSHWVTPNDHWACMHMSKGVSTCVCQTIKDKSKAKSASLFYKRIILLTFFSYHKKAIYKRKNQNEAAQNDYE